MATESIGNDELQRMVNRLEAHMDKGFKSLDDRLVQLAATTVDVRVYEADKRAAGEWRIALQKELDTIRADFRDVALRQERNHKEDVTALKGDIEKTKAEVEKERARISSIWRLAISSFIGPIVVALVIAVFVSQRGVP